MNAHGRHPFEAFSTERTGNIFRLPVLLLLLLLGVVFAGAGCGLFHKKAPPVTYNDPQLKEKVESALKPEPLLKDHHVTVRSINGVVELSGEVDSIVAKERAGLAAAAVSGIVQVKNDLLVRSQPARNATH